MSGKALDALGGVQYSPDAEKAVLGCFLTQPHDVFDHVSALNAEDFFVPANIEVFRTLVAMHQKLQPIDTTTVMQALVDGGMNEQLAGGTVAELLMGFATHLNVGAYVTIVKDKSLLRRLQAICASTVTDIANNADDATAVLARAESRVCGLASDQSTSDIRTARQCVAEFRERILQTQEGHIEARFKTGLRSLDEINGGFPVPGYVVVAGPPGVGKSAFMLGILKNACEEGVGVGCFSIEMTRPALIQRLTANIASIDSRRMNGKLHPRELEDVEVALQKIEQWPFFIDSTSRLTPSDLRSKARQMVKKGCRIIELDYIQLMQGSSSADKRREQLVEVSNTIAQLAKELNILFIVLAQINREARKRGDYQSFDLAECSAIEQDARVILMLEPHKNAEMAPKNAVPIIGQLVKYSEGQTGKIDLTLNMKEQRIS